MVFFPSLAIAKGYWLSRSGLEREGGADRDRAHSGVRQRLRAVLYASGAPVARSQRRVNGFDAVVQEID